MNINGRLEHESFAEQIRDFEKKKKKISIHVFHCFLFAFRVNIKRVFTDTFTDNELHCRQTRDMEAANLMFKFDSLL